MSQEHTSVSPERESHATHISSLLRRLTKLYDSRMGKDLKEIGITQPQMMVLKQVLQESRTLGQISAAVQLSNSTVSGILDRLERDGWIERVRDETDRRIIWIRRTDKVYELRNKFALFRDGFFDHLFDDLSQTEIANVVSSLDILITHLEAKLDDEASRS